jgi:HK97 family phage prohead protease
MRDVYCAPLELKFAAENPAGSFAGYASVFGSIDGGGDMIAPGAFSASLSRWQAKGFTMPMYMQHGPILGADPRPVGVWTKVAEDAKGLAVEGRLIGLDTETGKYNHALVKEGAMQGLSIGYRVKKADYGRTASEPRRTIKELHLAEISIVDNPMDAFARISAVKAADMTEREMERLLTQDAGLSRSEARALMRHGISGLKAMQDAGEEFANDVMESLKRNVTILNPSK